MRGGLRGMARKVKIHCVHPMNGHKPKEKYADETIVLKVESLIKLFWDVFVNPSLSVELYEAGFWSVIALRTMLTAVYLVKNKFPDKVSKDKWNNMIEGLIVGLDFAYKSYENSKNVKLAISMFNKTVEDSALADFVGLPNDFHSILLPSVYYISSCKKGGGAKA